MPKSSHLEVISDRDNAADCADKYADREERDEHDNPHLRKRNYLHKGYCKTLRNFSLQCLIQTPLGKERKSAAGNAKHESLNNKGASNEAVGCADHLHYGDLFSSAVGRELYGIAHDKQRHKAEYSDEHKRYYAYDVANGDKFIRKFGGRVDLIDTVNIFYRGFSCVHLAKINKLNDKAMAEDLFVETLHIAFVILFKEVLTCLAAAYKVYTCDIIERLKLCLYLRGRFLCGHILVNIGKDLVLIADILDYLVDVYIKKREAAHYYQAGNYYRDRGKGHKSVRKHIAEALAYKISVSIQLHNCSTRPFRRL